EAGVMPKYLPRRKARSEPDGALATRDLVKSRQMQSLGELIGGNSHGLDELGTQDFSGAGCHRLFVRPWVMSQTKLCRPYRTWVSSRIMFRHSRAGLRLCPQGLGHFPV